MKLTKNETETLRKAVEIQGLRSVARKLGINRVSLLRLLAEVVPVRDATVIEARSSLPKVRA